MQLTGKEHALRRRLAAAVVTLLGAGLAGTPAAHAAEGSRLPPLEIDPSLLPAPGSPAPPPPASTPDLGPYHLNENTSGTAIQPAVSKQTPWRVDSGFLVYSEANGRVQTDEAVVQVSRLYPDDSAVNVRVVVDSLTGGSPNGALPSKAAQTFSTPSGTTLNPAAAGGGSAVQTYTTASGTAASGGSSGHSTLYTVAPGALPLDNSFMDQRIAVNLGEELPLDAANRLNVSGALSHEHDFVSASLSASLAHDLNEHNTTLSVGFNLEDDLIQPIGGAPIPWSDYGKFLKQGDKSKHVGDLLLGISQVVNRRWLTQLNYSLDSSNGYQNDPYKILSVLDGQGSTLGYVYENRPASRVRQSVYWANKVAFDHDVVDLSLRYMHDDWGISSSTVDLHYHFKLDATSYLEPHFRRYHQTAANFYHLYLAQGTGNLNYASADPRLADFDATTLGLKFGMPLGAFTECSLRIERYTQTGKTPVNLPTGLEGLNLYPGLQAWVLQAGFAMVF